MPNVYAQKMIDALNQVGQPIVTKQTGTTSGTTTTSQDVPMDLGTLMAMIMMMIPKNRGEEEKKKGYDPSTDNPWDKGSKPSYSGSGFSLPAPSTPGAESGVYPGAGIGNPSEALADALAGIATSGYVNRNPNLVMPGTQLPTGTNPLARLTPADIIKLMLG